MSWRLTTFGGRLVAKNTAVDFRYGEPPRQAFCTVYAPGTEQNFAAVDGTYNYGKAGRYLFDLTPNLIDVSRLPPGRYRVEVTASDVGGNWATRSVTVRIVPGHGERGPTAPDPRCDTQNGDATLADGTPAAHCRAAECRRAGRSGTGDHPPAGSPTGSASAVSVKRVYMLLSLVDEPNPPARAGR